MALLSQRSHNHFSKLTVNDVCLIIHQLDWRAAVRDDQSFIAPNSQRDTSLTREMWNRSQCRTQIPAGAVIVHYRNMRCIARLLDRSRNGVCVSFPAKLEINERVTVKAAGYPLKEGKIAWHRNGYTGIRFMGAWVRSAS